MMLKEGDPIVCYIDIYCANMLILMDLVVTELHSGFKQLPVVYQINIYLITHDCSSYSLKQWLTMNL